MNTHAGRSRSSIVIVALGAVLAGPTLVWLLLPAVGGGESPTRSRCKHNLKQIGLAMHNYHDAYGCLPPAYLTDADGRRIHSWRVLILPQLGRQDLFDKYRLDEPWDGPNNAKLHDVVLDVYRCPSDQPDVKSRFTSYAAIVGPRTPFPGESAVTFREMPDGLSNTILVAEIKNSGIHWMEPRDLDFDELVISLNPAVGRAIASAHIGGAQTVLGDGSVRFISDSLASATLRRLILRDDGDPAGDF